MSRYSKMPGIGHFQVVGSAIVVQDEADNPMVIALLNNAIDQNRFNWAVSHGSLANNDIAAFLAASTRLFDVLVDALHLLSTDSDLEEVSNPQAYRELTDRIKEALWYADPNTPGLRQDECFHYSQDDVPHTWQEWIDVVRSQEQADG